ncbi:MAG TPA: hypothetical protein VFB19_18505 [Mycobacterium sp.]|nr:hypothetical protein [Mycobacterium sp.]
MGETTLRETDEAATRALLMGRRIVAAETGSFPTLDYGHGVLLDVDADGVAVGVETVGNFDFTFAMWLIATKSRIGGVSGRQE